MRLGDKAEAKKQFEAALAIEPDCSEAHCQLGNLLLIEGRATEACEHFRHTLESEPREISALNNLAWVMATTADESLRDGKGAVEFAERAAEVTKRSQPVVLMTLAASYAAATRFEEANATAGSALDLAEQRGDNALADTLRMHLEAYRAGRPLRDGPAR